MKQLKDVEAALREAPMAVPYNSDFLIADSQPTEYIISLNKTFKATKDELKTTQEKLADTVKKLNEVEADLQTKTTDLASAKNELATKSAELTATKAKFTELESKLNTIVDDLGGREAKVVVSQLTESTEKLKALEREKKIIEDSLAQKVALINKFEDQDRLRSRGYAPDDLSGKVMAINKAWNFVVLDVGKDNRLVEGVELLVYRGETLIGKVRSVSVDATSAVADILPDSTKQEIQVGDRVIFGYK
jgi:DNA repair exonuclease SbcCD ATPase subunit